MGLLTPDPGTLFWMVIIFGIVFFILAKYAFPVITGMVDKRKQYIDSSLEAARQANEQLQQVKAESEALLARAHEEQTAILKEASATASSPKHANGLAPKRGKLWMKPATR